MGFLNPLLLWGSALVSVPIIIYLINLRRYQRRPWAAMEFLLRALKKHRRRLQLENLLLLLVRVAAMLLLAGAMARPFLRSTPIGALTEKEENWIFALDTSYSMGFKDGGRSLFDRAQEAVSAMVQDLVKPRDRVAVLTLDASPQVVVPPTVVSDSTRQEVASAVGELRPGFEATNLTASLLALRDLANRFEPELLSTPAGGGSAGILSKKIVLFSDFQRRDWLEEEAPRDPIVLGIVGEIKQAGGELNLGKLEGSGHNLSIMDLSLSPPVVARDVWTEVRATVRNWSNRDFEQVEVKFLIDGQEESSMVMRVPAGETRNTPTLPYRFAEAGHHTVAVELRSDGLAADNRRFLALRVLEDARVLLVDGEPGSSQKERETLHLLAALSPDPTEAGPAAAGRLTPYTPMVQGVENLMDTDPREYLVVVLANVSADSLPERFVRDLQGYVRDGGCLMVFLGKNVDPADYNDDLLKLGLVPARLIEPLVRTSPAFHLVAADPEHPLVRYFEERREVTSLFGDMVEFKQFYRVAVEPPAPVAPDGAGGEGVAGGRPPAPAQGAPRISFSFDDPEQSPAVIDAPLGLGRVLLFTSTADVEWNEFPKWPDFVAFLYQAIPYLVGYGQTELNLDLGRPYRQVFDAAQYAQEVMLIRPDEMSVSKAMTKLEDENRFLITHEETSLPGIYELRFQRPAAARPAAAPGGEAGAEPAGESPREQGVERGGGGGRPEERASRQFFAVNLDPREGDLRSLTVQDLKDHFSSLGSPTGRGGAHFFDPDRELLELGKKKSLARGTELWRPILLAVLGLLLLETFLAQLFGRTKR